MLRVPILLLLLLPTLPACGERTEPQEEKGTAATELAVPEDPELALAWVHAAAEDPKDLRKRLAAWPLDEEAFTFVTESQIALTWRIRLALQDLRIADAHADLARLEQDYEGEGESPEGATFDRRTLALGIFESALRAARQTMEGSTPSPKRAAALLTRAEGLLDSSDRVDRQRVSGLRQFLLAAELAPLLSFLGLPPEGPTSDPVRGAIVFVDDYTLGELPFTDVLARWQRDGARVQLVPVLRGQVRVGLRLLPAASREAELASFEAHARKAGLIPYSGAPVAGAALERLGLGRQEVLILVHDEKGRILGRVAGINPDLHPLDPVVQRLVSR